MIRRAARSTSLVSSVSQTRQLATAASVTPQAAAAGNALLDRLLGNSPMPRVSLDQPFPAAVNLKPADFEPATPQITTLPNGIRAVTLASHSPIASLGLFVETGPRWETRANSGITHFLETMAFKSTHHRSDFRLVRDMGRLGANVTCQTSRESLYYGGDCLQPFVPYIAKMIAEITLHPAFHDFEVRQAAMDYKKFIKERNANVDNVMSEAIHAAAYRDNTLGRPIYASEASLSKFNSELLESYRKAHFAPKRMVVAGVGIDHNEFVQMMGAWYGELLPESAVPGYEEPEKAPVQYTGGEIKMHNPELTEGAAHFSLAFETAGWNNESDLVPMCVLQMLFGGGGSFSAGGPGKGMYSRLYENVLNRHEWVNHIASFNSINNDSSLFGVQGTCAGEDAPKLTAVIVQEYLRVASEPVSEIELTRAKNALKSSVYMQLESRALTLNDLGQQMLVYGHVKSPRAVADLIDKVTAADIQRVAQAMLKTQPTIAATGDTSFVPRYDQIAQRLK